VRTYSFALDGKYGLADTEGNELIHPRYDWLGNSFEEDMLIVGVRGKGLGFVNRHGIEIVPPTYDEARDFYQGQASVRLNGKWGAIDKRGKIVVPLIHTTTGRHIENICIDE
jgi:hypothetical protein